MNMQNTNANFLLSN